MGKAMTQMYVCIQWPFCQHLCSLMFWTGCRKRTPHRPFLTNNQNQRQVHEQNTGVDDQCCQREKNFTHDNEKPCKCQQQSINYFSFVHILHSWGMLHLKMFGDRQEILGRTERAPYMNWQDAGAWTTYLFVFSLFAQQRRRCLCVFCILAVYCRGGPKFASLCAPEIRIGFFLNLQNSNKPRKLFFSFFAMQKDWTKWIPSKLEQNAEETTDSNSAGTTVPWFTIVLQTLCQNFEYSDVSGTMEETWLHLERIKPQKEVVPSCVTEPMWFSWSTVSPEQSGRFTHLRKYRFTKL